MPVAAEPAPQPQPETERTSTTEIAETEPASTEPATTEPEPQADQFPAGTYVEVRQDKRKVRAGHISHRIDEQHWRVRLLGAPEEVTILVNAAQLYRAEEPEPAPEAKAVKRQRHGQTTAPQRTSRSRYAIDPEAIAAGKLPDTAPVVTTKANQLYQKHFDRLFGLAKAGDWDAVRNYKVTGSNSYSKMIARYRKDLLTLHAASEAPNERAQSTGELRSADPTKIVANLPLMNTITGPPVNLAIPPTSAWRWSRIRLIGSRPATSCAARGFGRPQPVEQGKHRCRHYVAPAVANGRDPGILRLHGW